MSILSRSESRGGAKVIWLAVHSTEGNDVPRVDDAAALRDADWWTGSAHAICDNESLLTPAEGCVPYERAAWTLRGGNHYSDNIEQVGWARWTRAEWLAHPGTLNNTARWLAARSKARGIPLVKLSPTDVAARKSGVIGHVDYTLGTGDGTHSDPGPNYPWDVVITAARRYANPTPAPEDFMATMSDAEKALLMEMVTTYLPGKPGVHPSGPGWDRLVAASDGVAKLLNQPPASVDPKALAGAIVAALPAQQAQQVAELVLGGLDGAKLSVAPPA